VAHLIKLEKYFKANDLNVHLDKTKVIVFSKSGRIPKGLNFACDNKNIEVIKQYTYLGVPFYSSTSFALTAKNFKEKGIRALTAIWKIFLKGKVEEWTSHQALFNSIVTATALYASHIWGLKHMALIEQVQSRFIKRLLQLRTNTASYLLRLETGNVTLEFQIIKKAIKFIQKIENESNDRYAKICWLELLKQKRNPKTGNWAFLLADLLQKRLGNIEMNTVIQQWKTYEPVYKQALYLEDIASINASLKNNFLRNNYEPFTAQKYLRSNLTLPTIRILAQLRINNGYFYYQENSFDFHEDINCTICNSTETQDRIHILKKCSVHRNARLELIKEIPELEDWNLEQLCHGMNLMSREKFIAIYHFITYILRYRHFLANLENNIN